MAHVLLLASAMIREFPDIGGPIWGSSYVGSRDFWKHCRCKVRCEPAGQLWGHAAAGPGQSASSREFIAR